METKFKQIGKEVRLSATFAAGFYYGKFVPSAVGKVKTVRIVYQP